MWTRTCVVLIAAVGGMISTLDTANGQSVVVYRPLHAPVAPTSVVVQRVAVPAPLPAAYVTPTLVTTSVGYAPSVVVQRPVTLYSPVVTSTPMAVVGTPVVANSPPTVTYSPVITYSPTVTYSTYSPVVVSTKVYVPGQPIRNFLRAITP